MAREHNFHALTVWTGSRQAPTSSYEAYSREFTVSVAGKPTVTGSASGAFRGDESLPNPEDMLLASISACHLLSYLAVCARIGVEVVAYEDRCEARMTFHEGKMRIVEATLHPVVTIQNPADVERAEAAHTRANAECFIANSVSFPVHHKPTTQVAPQIETHSLRQG